MSEHRSKQLAGIFRTVISRHAVQIPPDVATVVTITEVRVSEDLGYADIAVSAIDGRDRAAQYLQARAKQIRQDLHTQFSGHTLPQLRFHPDLEGERLDRLDRLIGKL